jgi:GntR family transcriptional regulator
LPTPEAACYGGKWISPAEVTATPAVQEAPPKYVQIANHVRDRIIRGDLKPGDEIPSERQIVEEWGVSRPTATRALAALRAEGLVEARQGSGTFVRAQPQLHRRARDRYARSRATGRAYTEGEWSEIVAAESVPAPEHVGAELGLKPGASAIRRKRVIFDPSGPLEVSVSWFDGSLAKRAPRLLERARIRQGTLAYVEQVTGRRGQTARDWIGARQATAEEVADLKLGPKAAAVLAVRHLTVDASGTPLEFVEASFPPDRWTFEQEYPIPG